jgi:putative sugar O-methyltransferase
MNSEIISKYNLFLNKLLDHQDNFKSNSLNLSSKYEKISSKASSEIFSGHFSYQKIRSWSEQDDLGVPVQLRRLLSLDSFTFVNFIRYLRYLSPDYWARSKFQKQALQDDLNIIKESGYVNLLIKNPITKTPFVRDIYIKDKLKFNSRYLRYIYISGQINKYKLLSRREYSVHVDIGGFYGGLQGILFNEYSNTTFISVELPHQLFRSFLYHKLLYPEVVQIVGIREFESYMSSATRKNGFIYLSPLDYDSITKITHVDLLTNFLSFGEMSRSNFDNYMKSKTTLNSKSYYFVNRFISSPKYEQTYDANINVMDYFIPQTELKLFDIFPIHHYMITKRGFLGRDGFRNVSSPQFELIQTK